MPICRQLPKPRHPRSLYREKEYTKAFELLSIWTRFSITCELERQLP
jgi:hypothetical protein